MSKKTYTAAERKAQMLEAGAKLAAKHGAVNVTRKMVAEACKCAEGLVSVYMGDSPTAQKAYARKAKALGLTLPDKATAEAIGVKLRAHGPRDKRDMRTRSPKEKVAIAKKAAAKRATPAKKAVKREVLPREHIAARASREVKPTTPRERKPKVSPALPLPSPAKPARKAPENKASAARKPKNPPVPVQQPVD